MVRDSQSMHRNSLGHCNTFTGGHKMFLQPLLPVLSGADLNSISWDLGIILFGSCDILQDLNVTILDVVRFCEIQAGGAWQKRLWGHITLISFWTRDLGLSWAIVLIIKSHNCRRERVLTCLPLYRHLPWETVRVHISPWLMGKTTLLPRRLKLFTINLEGLRQLDCADFHRTGSSWSCLCQSKPGSSPIILAELENTDDLYWLTHSPCLLQGAHRITSQLLTPMCEWHLLKVTNGKLKKEYYPLYL